MDVIVVKSSSFSLLQTYETGVGVSGSYKFMQAGQPHRSILYSDVKFLAETESPVDARLTIWRLGVGSKNLDV